MRLKLIREGVYMKGENELHLNHEAMCEFLEQHWNERIVMHDKDKIVIEAVEWNARTKKFVVVFRQKPLTK